MLRNWPRCRVFETSTSETTSFLEIWNDFSMSMISWCGWTIVLDLMVRWGKYLDCTYTLFAYDSNTVSIYAEEQLKLLSSHTRFVLRDTCREEEGKPHPDSKPFSA